MTMTSEKNKYFVTGGVAFFLIFCGFIVFLNKKIVQEVEQSSRPTVVAPTEKSVTGAVVPSAPAGSPEMVATQSAAGVDLNKEKEGPARAETPANAVEEEPLTGPILLQ